VGCKIHADGGLSGAFFTQYNNYDKSWGLHTTYSQARP